MRSREIVYMMEEEIEGEGIGEGKKWLEKKDGNRLQR